MRQFVRGEGVKEELLVYLKVKIDYLEESCHVRQANTCKNYLDVILTCSEALKSGGAHDDHVQPKNSTTGEVETRSGRKRSLAYK